MNRRVRSLSDHFRYLALAKIDVGTCASWLENSFKRFGPVRRTCYDEAGTALNSLLPLRSFSTRFLIFETSGWCLLLTDMIGQSCFAEVYALSRHTRCPAVAAEFSEHERTFRYINKGEIQRSLSCYADGTHWYFEQAGSPLDFEITDHYTRRAHEERLKPNVVIFYLNCATEIAFPFDQEKMKFDSICGIARSLDQLRVPLMEFPFAPAEP